MNPNWLLKLRWVLIHYLAFCFMQAMALLAEMRRGPALPDLLHDLLPYWPALDWFNSFGWFFLLILSWIFLLWLEDEACLLYFKVGSLVSVLRGLFLPLTNLGHPLSKPLPLPLQDGVQVSDFLSLCFPLSFLWGETQTNAFALTQDLFFSGHTAVTFLLALLPSKRPLKIFFIAFHFITVLVLLLTRIHYSIDIVSAYFFVWVLFQWVKNLSPEKKP